MEGRRNLSCGLHSLSVACTRLRLPFFYAFQIRSIEIALKRLRDGGIQDASVRSHFDIRNYFLALEYLATRKGRINRIRGVFRDWRSRCDANVRNLSVGKWLKCLGIERGNLGIADISDHGISGREFDF